MVIHNLCVSACSRVWCGCLEAIMAAERTNQSGILWIRAAKSYSSGNDSTQEKKHFRTTVLRSDVGQSHNCAEYAIKEQSVLRTSHSGKRPTAGKPMWFRNYHFHLFWLQLVNGYKYTFELGFHSTKYLRDQDFKEFHEKKWNDYSEKEEKVSRGFWC